MINPYTTVLPSKFEIGIAEIDVQHSRLYSLLERLRHSGEKNYGYAVNAILAELDVEVRIHFSVEESLMQLLSFPETDAHVSEHRHLTQQLKQFRQRAQDHDVSDDLAGFIKMWLTDHIDRFDRQFVAHFLSRGVHAGAADTAK
jgi:hemerythrin